MTILNTKMLMTVAIGVLSTATCRDPSVAEPDAVAGDSTPATTTLQWNEIARGLVASHNTSGPMASRVYALVSVAQLAAVANAGVSRPSDRAAIARASADVLRELYPDTAAQRLVSTQLVKDDPTSVATGTSGRASADDSLGAAAARRALARAATDGASGADCPATPPTPASRYWHDDATPPNPRPQLPCFGKVRPWLYADITVFRADPAPAFDSPAFRDGLVEVRHISDTRTDGQLATIDRWLDGNNTFTPPGHWNLIAADLIAKHRVGEAEAARIFALLNVAMMDTHVACWDRKMTSWEIRPWMVDSGIVTPRGRPHHPSDPSGHACAGGAGSGVLGALFPAQRDSLLALGDEEGFTTVLSGVHYRFDVDRGLRIGRTIAAKALELKDRSALLRAVLPN